MADRKGSWLVASMVVAFGQAGVAAAQNQEVGGAVGYSGRVSASGGSSSGLYLELQGRLDAFNVAGVEGVLVDSGDGGGGGGGRVGGGLSTLSAPAIPFVTAGVRLLEGDLFVGLGVGFNSASATSDTPAGEAKASRSSFMLVPVVTYDLLGDGPAALYGLGMLNIGSIGSGDNDPGPPVESGFWWGLNLGAGVRGDITENVSLFSELGWGFASGSWSSGGVDQSRFVHGLFGTLGFAARLGL